jgi:hypothetical protein
MCPTCASNQISTTIKSTLTSVTVKWDSAISLAFAAEQLFAAAQLLTSDLVPWNRALRISYERHLVPLLENDSLLPEQIRDELLEAHRSYVSAKSRGMTPDFARQLARELMGILREVTGILNRIRGKNLLDIDQQAA